MNVIAKCECGNVKEMVLNNIRYGFSKSCGCQRSLTLSKIGRKRTGVFVETPDGPKSIKYLSGEFGIPYPRMMARYYSGIRDWRVLIKDERIGYRPRFNDVRLNGMSNAEAVEFFGMSKQSISHRLKAGWTVDRNNNWIQPNGKIFILEDKSTSRGKRSRAKQ